MKTTAILLIALLGLCAALPAKDSLQEDTPEHIMVEFARGMTHFLRLDIIDFDDCFQNGLKLSTIFSESADLLFKSSLDN